MALHDQYSAETFRNFQFFLGVVESREDPEQLGRVRVRCYGIHPDDKSKVPTEDLPWAMPIMPYTSASLSGIGASPTGPVEGTWVFGFFLDGQGMQQPMILGTLIGAPDKLPNPNLGFNDPEGIYPKIEHEIIGGGDIRGLSLVLNPESDVNKLARGDDIDKGTSDGTKTIRAGETTLAVKNEMAANTVDIPMAVPPKTDSVKDGVPAGRHPVEYFRRHVWDEPEPRYGNPYNKAYYLYKSKYPLNHVQVTESGHVFEVDDSPKVGRIHQYHRSGTFYEIQDDGTRITKIVGDDYQIYLKDKNMVVSGNVNITVDKADLRLYVTKEKDEKGRIIPGGKGGDLYIETDGDFNLNVKGNMTTKIQKSEHKEVITDSATQINGKQSLRVSKDRITNIGGAHREDIGTVTDGADHQQTITGSKSVIVKDNSYLIVTNKTTINSVNDDLSMSSGNNVNIKASANVNLQAKENFQANTSLAMDFNASTDVTIDTPTNVKIGNSTKPATVDIDGTAINLN